MNTDRAVPFVKEVLAGTLLSAWILSLAMNLTGSCCHEFYNNQSAAAAPFNRHLNF